MELQTLRGELRSLGEKSRVHKENLEVVLCQIEAERERYRTLFDLAPDGYVVTDLRGVIREANQAASRLFSVPQKLLQGKALAEFIASDARQDFMALLQRIPENMRVSWNVNIQPCLGESLPASITVSYNYPTSRQGEDGVLSWLIRNSSELERTTQQLAQVNQILHTFVQAAPLPIMVLDRERRVTLWNPVSEQFFGWTADEVIGKLLPTVPTERQTEFEDYQAQLYAGARHYGVETQRVTRSGELVDVAIWTAPLHNQAGSIIATVWLTVDISERKRVEEVRRQLLERVVMAQEEERARISRDLHDHLGQYLTGIMLGLKELEANASELTLGERPPSYLQVAKLREVVNELMHVSHRQAWELRPAELDDMGLASAVGHYVSDWAKQSGLKADFHAVGFEGRRLAGTVEITLYRVVQEALTNVLRHAHASRVDVVLELNENFVTAIIEDDGSGFDVSVKGNSKRGRLGLTGMSERLSLVGGTLEVESEIGQGTAIFARVPHPLSQNMSD